MVSLIASSAVRTCFGAGADTFAALLRGECGAGPLRHGDPDRLNVAAGYHIADGSEQEPFRAGRLLAECLTAVVATAELDTRRHRVVVLVGTGLRELSAVERWALAGTGFDLARLDFADVVGQSVVGAAEVVTLSNACSAGGHALALAQDMVELGDADAVVVAAADTSTLSMLAMIGHVADTPTERVRPFDADRSGVLLGDGAAAVVVVPDHHPGPALGRLAGTGLSCDASHLTAPDVDGVARAMTDALHRSGRDPSDVDLVLTHGTGTALNDPVECDAIRKVLIGGGADPLLTGVKGAVGHTSGAAALVNVDVALRCLSDGVVPPVSGLRKPLDEGADLRFVVSEPAPAQPRLVQVDAFGFGGVNAVTLLAGVG